MADPTPQPAQFRAGRWKFVAPVIALLLFTSATAKLAFVDGPAETNPIFQEYPWISTLIVQFEFSLAVLLVLGVGPAATWRLTSLTFSALTGAALGLWILGFSSCGCFGRLSVHPFITFVMDIATLAFLAWGRPAGVFPDRASGPARAWHRPAGWCCANGLLCGLTTLVVGFGNDLVVAADSERKLLADPSRWTGLEFPLLPHVDVAGRLREGRWKTVVFRRGCAHCETKLRELVDKSTDQAESVAILEVPPYAVGYKPDRSFLYGRLRQGESWRLRTPLVVDLDGGRVVSVE